MRSLCNIWPPLPELPGLAYWKNLRAHPIRRGDKKLQQISAALQTYRHSANKYEDLALAYKTAVSANTHDTSDRSTERLLELWWSVSLAFEQAVSHWERAHQLTAEWVADEQHEDQQPASASSHHRKHAPERHASSLAPPGHSRRLANKQKPRS